MEYKREQLKGFPKYEIDTEGIIYGMNGKPLKTDSKSGYAQVALRNEGKTTIARVHKLVLRQFSEEEEGKPFVVHINGNKRDNRLENLKWAKNNIEQYLNSTSETREKKRQEKEDKLEEKRKSRAVVACDDNGDIYKVYDNLTQAAQTHTDNLHSGKVQISYAIKQGKKVFGYYWRKLESYDVETLVE